MNYLIRSLYVLVAAALISCGGKDEKKEKENIQLGNYEKKEVAKPEASEPKGDLVDLSNKGVGPVENVDLPDEIDMAMAKEGEEIYNSKCTACHKPTKRFIGPAPIGILERRSPEWVMNMILNPEEMLIKDPVAKQLLVEFNGAPMANQNLNREEARKILEYFRTLEETN